jgi:hypothetical protein
MKNATEIRATPLTLAEELGIPDTSCYRALRFGLADGFLRIEKAKNAEKTKGPMTNYYVKA